MAKVLTLEEAKALNPPCTVWIESIGSYIEHSVPWVDHGKATHINKHFLLVDGAGYRWETYNTKPVGWRLWDEAPTFIDRATTGWWQLYGGGISRYPRQEC